MWCILSKARINKVMSRDDSGTFEVIRRYSDFDSVRQIMLNRWPGCYVPAIPSKKMVGNMDSQFIEDRRVNL